MPMVENDEITGTMRGDGENDPVSEFIGTYNFEFISCESNICCFFSLLQGKLYCRDVRLTSYCIIIALLFVFLYCIFMTKKNYTF